MWIVCRCVLFVVLGFKHVLLLFVFGLAIVVCCSLCGVVRCVCLRFAIDCCVLIAIRWCSLRVVCCSMCVVVCSCRRLLFGVACCVLLLVVFVVRCLTCVR